MTVFEAPEAHVFARGLVARGFNATVTGEGSRLSVSTDAPQSVIDAMVGDYRNRGKAKKAPKD